MINCLRTGFYHSKYPRKYTQEEARLEIAKLYLKPEFYSDIDKVLEKYISPFSHPYLIQLGEIVNKMFRLYSGQCKEDDK